jgi:hypothetical protein
LKLTVQSDDKNKKASEDGGELLLRRASYWSH